LISQANAEDSPSLHLEVNNEKQSFYRSLLIDRLNEIGIVATKDTLFHVYKNRQLLLQESNYGYLSRGSGSIIDNDLKQGHYRVGIEKRLF